MRRALSLVLLLFLSVVALYANPPGASRFSLQRAYELIDEGNPVLIEGYLKAWSAASPRDVDLFVAKFNVDFQRSVDTGSDSLFTLAMSHLNTAVGIQPRRLDLWLKTIFALNQRGYYADQADLMIALIGMSERFGHEWLWEGDQPLDESETVFLMTLHDHLEQWVGLETPPVAHIRRVAERLSVAFPRDGASRAAVGVSHLLEGSPADALPHLVRAAALEPRNGSFRLMLAEGYEQTGDIPNAIASYERLLDIGTDDMKTLARTRLTQIR